MRVGYGEKTVYLQERYLPHVLRPYLLRYRTVERTVEYPLLVERRTETMRLARRIAAVVVDVLV